MTESKIAKRREMRNTLEAHMEVNKNAEKKYLVFNGGSARGVIFILLSGLCFAFLGIFGKYFYHQGYKTGEILTIRFLIATFVLTLFFFFQLFRKKKNYFKSESKSILVAILLGIFGYALFSTLLFSSFKYLSVSLSVMLLFTFPFFVFAGSVFLKQERYTYKKLISLCLVAIGLFLLLSVEFKIENLNGVFLALASAFFYSLYILISTKFQKNIEALTSTFYVILAATITLYFYNQPNIFEILSTSRKETLIMFLALGVIGTVLPLFLFQAGLQNISGTRASVLGTVEPVLASLYALFFFGEPLSYTQLLGITIIIIADVLIII